MSKSSNDAIDMENIIVSGLPEKSSSKLSVVTPSSSGSWYGGDTKRKPSKKVFTLALGLFAFVAVVGGGSGAAYYVSQLSSRYSDASVPASDGAINADALSADTVNTLGVACTQTYTIVSGTKDRELI